MLKWLRYVVIGWVCQLKRGRVLFGLSIVFIIVSFLPVHRFLPEWSQTTGYYDLGPGHVNGPTVELFYLSTIELNVGITGSNKDVFCYITDSSGEVIFDAGRIYDGYHLVWDAPTIDSFRINFDNTMSWFSNKQVGWSCKVFHYKTLFLFLGIGLLILGSLQIFREENVIHRIKNFLFKEPEPTEVECKYCGTIYSKTLHKCPHCGARREIGIPKRRKISWWALLFIIKVEFSFWTGAQTASVSRFDS